MPEQIQPGQYYRKRVEAEDETDLAAGSLVLVIAVDASKVEFETLEGGYYTSPESFLDEYDHAPEGASERQARMAALFEEMREEQLAAARIGEGFGASVLEIGEDAGDGAETSALTVNQRSAVAIGRKVRAARADMARLREASLRRQEEFEALAREQRRALEAQARRLGRLVERAGEVLWGIDLYLGRKEEIERLTKGTAAAADEPIVIRQLVLFMDEECQAAAEEGGIDVDSIDAFDAWIRVPENLALVLPEPKGVVALKVRREKKNYAEPWLDAAYAQKNEKTYFVARSGENVFRICTNLEVGDVLFPRADEFDELFVFRNYDFDSREYRESRLRPGSHAYMTALEKADRKQRHYMRIALFLQGLLDRTPVFFPLPAPKINILDRKGAAAWLRFVADAERVLGDGRPSFSAWLADLNARLDVGHRVVGAFHSYSFGLGRDEDRKYRITPRGASLPEDYALHTIARREGQKWIILYEASKYWGGPMRRRASCRLDPHDRFFVNFDLATEEDCAYYLTDRLHRRDYVRMLPLLRRVEALKRREAEAEAPFRLLLAAEISRRHGVDLEEAAGAVGELIRWWKFKVREHRALTSDDSKALRMIVGEFGRRQAMARERSGEEAAVAATVRAIREAEPEAMLVAHKGEGLYVALVPHDDDEHVFVREVSWKQARNGVLERSGERAWVVVDARADAWAPLWSSERWEAWPRRLRRRDFLTGPELAELVDGAWPELAERVTGGRRSGGGARACYRPLSVTITRDHSITFWVWNKHAKVPRRHIVTSAVERPSVGTSVLGWTRTARGIDRGLRWFSDSTAYSGEKGFWKSGFGREESARKKAKVIWSDEAAIAECLAEVEAAEAVIARRAELSGLAHAYAKQAAAEVERRRHAHAYAEFMEEYAAPDLWEGHLKTLRISAPYPRGLARAFGYLVERDLEVVGRTVGDLVEAAKQCGFAAGRDDDDLEVAPNDYVILPLEEEPEDDDADEPGEDWDDEGGEDDE